MLCSIPALSTKLTEGFRTIPQPLFHVLQLIHRDSVKLAGSSLKHAVQHGVQRGVQRVRDAQVS